MLSYFLDFKYFMNFMLEIFNWIFLQRMQLEEVDVFSEIIFVGYVSKMVYMNLYLL